MNRSMIRMVLTALAMTVAAPALNAQSQPETVTSTLRRRPLRFPTSGSRCSALAALS